MSFDEEPERDPHGECREEIHRLTALARRAGEALEKLTTCSCPKQALCIFSPQLGCERCALIHDLRAAGLLDEGREG